MHRPVAVMISVAVPLLLLLVVSTHGAGAPVFDPANPLVKRVLWQSCTLCLNTTYQSTKTASSTNYTLVPFAKRATRVNAYYLALPEAYTSSPTAKFPVILYLHGGGGGSTGDGSNTDPNLTKILQNGQLKLVNNGSWNNYTDAARVVRPLPFIIIAPQTLAAAWDMPSEQVPANNGSGFAQVVNGSIRMISQINEEANRDCDIVLKDAISRLRIDQNRIYVTGLSQGGFGTWQAVVRYPNVFAAAVPTAAKYGGLSGLNPLPICRAKEIPTWAFHNDGDPRIPFYPGDKAVNDVNACHPDAADRKAKMHIYVGGVVDGKTAAERMQQYDAQGRPYTFKGSNSHDSWGTTYATFDRFRNVKNNGTDLNIYAFLLQHQKVAD